MWGSDELIYLDISKSDQYDLRDDQGYANRQTFLEIVQDVSQTALCLSRLVAKLNHIILKQDRAGADKVYQHCGSL